MTGHQFRSAFDPDQSFVVRKPMRLAGEDLRAGSTFPKHRVTVRRLRQLFDSRYLAYPGETGRDLVKAGMPERFGKWMRSMRGAAAPEAQDTPTAPGARPHFPSNMSQPLIRKTLDIVADEQDEFEDDDLAPVLNRLPPIDAPSLMDLVAAEPPVPRAAPAEVIDPGRVGAHVQIPEDWQTLTWPKLLSLASNFSMVRLMNKAEATDAIEAELGRRTRARAAA